MIGMTCALLVMNAIYWPPRLESTKGWWFATFGGEVYWPWFTLIGTVVAVGAAWCAALFLPPAKADGAHEVK